MLKDMNTNHSENLKVSFPKWVFIPGSFGWVLVLMACIFYLIKSFQSDFPGLELLKAAFLFILGLGGIWFFLRILFYSVTATDRGLYTNNIVGSNKSFSWDEVVEVQRPRFGIPVDFSFVVSSSKERLLLVRSMKNYNELIQLIKAKAPNLKRCQS